MNVKSIQLGKIITLRGSWCVLNNPVFLFGLSVAAGIPSPHSLPLLNNTTWSLHCHWAEQLLNNKYLDAFATEKM